MLHADKKKAIALLNLNASAEVINGEDQELKLIAAQGMKAELVMT